MSFVPGFPGSSSSDSSPQSGDLIGRTLIKSTVDRTYGQDEVVTFDEAVYDELGLWNPLENTKLTIPDGVSNVILNFSHATLISQSGMAFYLFRKNGLNTSLASNFRSRMQILYDNFFEYDNTIKTCFLPVSSGDYFEIQTSTYTNKTNILRGELSSLEVECYK